MLRHEVVILKRMSDEVLMKTGLSHRRTRNTYLYNGCLARYNVVLTLRVHLSVKYSQQSQLRTRATVE